MKNLTTKFIFFIVAAVTLNLNAQVITVNGILLPSSNNASGHIAEELLIGGPSSDFMNLTFPFPQATSCPGTSIPSRTLNQEIDTYGKVILLVTSPSDCPYCQNAAEAANAAIIARLPNIRLWYAASKLGGQTSDCNEINMQKSNSRYPFLSFANFTFMEAYWWDNTIGRPHSNDNNTAYLMGPGMPSSYRIIDPVARKVVDYGYFLDVSALDAAIANNFNPGGSVSLSTNNLSFAASASGINFSITSTGTWTISDNASWLFTSTTSGSGTRVVTATVSPNLSINTRNAVITITSGSVSKTINVSQQGATPIFNVNPLSLSFASASGLRAVISVTSNMPWSASGNPSWITLNTTSGVSSAVITVTSGININVASRTGSISFAAGIFSATTNITQTGAAAILDVHTTTASSLQVGGSTNVSVTSNISWVASKSASWLSLGATNGTGNGVVALITAANPTFVTRSTIFTISGGAFSRLITITQQALTPSLSVNSTSETFTASASQKNMTVTSNLVWSVSKNASWITLNPTTGANNGSFDISVMVNTSTTGRSSVITLSGEGLNRLITVTQAGAAEILTPNLFNLVYNSGGSTKLVSITSNINWVVVASAAWIKPNISNGAIGVTEMSILADPNVSLSPRNGSLTVSGGALKQIINVGQNGASAVITLSSSNLLMPSAASFQTITITTNSFWNLTVPSNWLSASQVSGNGNAVVTINSQLNASTNSRSQLLVFSVPGSMQSVLVNQEGAVPALSTNVPGFSTSSAGGTQNINVSSNTNWLVSSSDTWIVISTTSGSGNQTVAVNVLSNNSINKKIGQITFSYGSANTKIVNVTIAGATPVLNVSNNSLLSNSNANSFNINILSNISWIVTASDTWITSNVSSGSANAVVNIGTTENNTVNPRIGTITVSGNAINQFISITQTGLNKVLTVSSSNLVLGSTSSTQNLNITSNISWIVEKSENWLSTNLTTGQGNAVLEISYLSNPTNIARNSTITLSGNGLKTMVSINQDGATPLLVATPKTLNYSANSVGTQQVNLSSNLVWTVSNNTTWITLSTLSGNANGQIDVNVLENTSTQSRSAAYTIAGFGLYEIVEVNQLGANQVLDIPESILTLSSAAGTSLTTITSNSVWEAKASPSWATLSISTASGTSELQISYTENPSSRFRSAVITITGGNEKRFITLNQNGGLPFLNLTTTSVALPAVSNNTTIGVLSNLNWTVNKQATWIILSKTNGTDFETFNIGVTSNSSTQPRTGFVTVSGLGINKIVEVNQTGANQTLSFSASTITVSSDVNSSLFQINSNTFWTITGLPSWLTADPTRGSNNASVILTPTQNTDVNSRSIVLTITGQKGANTITVRQNGRTLTKLSDVDVANSDISIYPNPVHQGDIVQILGNSSSFNVYDILGVLQKVSSIDNKLNTSSLHQGIYFIKFKNNKIVKLIID